MTAAFDLSVMMGVYNGGVDISSTLHSLFAQEGVAFEIVVVDDGSTDDTVAVGDALAAEHPDIIRVLHRPNGGPGAAREAGRLAARGDFIQYLDSDDLLLPRKFALRVAALDAQPEAGIAYGLMRYRNEMGNEIACDWKPANQVQRTILYELAVRMLGRQRASPAAVWIEHRR